MKDTNLENISSMGEFVSPTGTRRDARFVVRQIATAIGRDLTDLGTDAQCKAWADDISGDDLQRGLREFGTLLCKALAKLPTSPAQTVRNQSIGRTIAKTFVRLGSVSVRHASNRKSPFDSGKFAVECFTTAEYRGTHAAIGWALKGAGKTILTPDTDTDTDTLSDPLHDMPPMAELGDNPPLPIGASRNQRGDITYTQEGAAQAAQHAAQRAVELDRKIRPEGARALTLTLRLNRVSKVARNLRTDLAQARADLAQARADLAQARADLAPKVPTKRTGTKRTATK